MGHGAYEINPIMAYYLTVGPHAFIVLKYALTSMGVIILLILIRKILNF